MNTPFDPWLAQLAVAGKGPHEFTIDRGQPFYQTWAVQGDWTGAVAACALRLTPDAPTALAALTVTNLGYSAGFTSFSLELSATDTADPAKLPADADGDWLVPLAFDFVIKPAGGRSKRLFGGVAIVAGKVTNAL